MQTDPRTPAELKQAFLDVLTAEQRGDPLVLVAINELIDKIELVYCGEYELTPIEKLFGRSLIEMHEQEKLND